MKNLISQEEMLEKTKSKELIIRVFPFKFNNGYFVEGVDNHGLKKYSTIREENKSALQEVLNYQRESKNGAP